MFMFCALGLVFGDTMGVVSRVNVLCSRTRFRLCRVPQVSFSCLGSRTRFRRFRGRAVPFSYFPHPDSISTVPEASRPIFLFCTPGLIFGGTEGAVSRFHVLRCRTRFGRRVPFSCFALPDSF
jgi:hypothetical protein